MDAIKEKGRVTDYQDVIADEGVRDKRLLVVQTEFGTALRLMEREGNTLSPTMRQAWDTGDLRILNKNSPEKASGAHISIIGHITSSELFRYMHKTEMLNGFANRYLFVCARRSKILPEGGSIDKNTFRSLQEQVHQAVKYAKTVGEMTRDAEARKIWAEAYPSLSAGHPGLFGAVTSRAEAQVTRLSCIFALLDKSPIVRAVHLKAALAFWSYCEDSARYVFGDSLGNPTADRIWKALKAPPQGLTKTEISQIFDGNKSADEIDRALSFLQNLGMAHAKSIKTTNKGRAAEVWQASGIGTYETNEIDESDEKRKPVMIRRTASISLTKEPGQSGHIAKLNGDSANPAKDGADIKVRRAFPRKQVKYPSTPVRRLTLTRNLVKQP